MRDGSVATREPAAAVLPGELDIATVPRLDRALRRAATDTRLVVLDLRAPDTRQVAAAPLRHLTFDTRSERT